MGSGTPRRTRHPFLVLRDRTATRQTVQGTNNNNMIIVKQGWRDKQQQNKKAMVDDITHILNNYQPEFGDFKAERLPMNALRVLLLTEGPYHSAWGTEGDRNYRYMGIWLEVQWISLSFLMANYDFVFSLFYLALSVQGSF